MKIKPVTFIFLFISLLGAGCKSTEQEAISQTKRGIVASSGMVVSAHPEASKIGVAILKKGGNAYDAAVATEFALAVAYPRAGNIGGGGFLVYRKGNGEIGALDYREKAPKAASRDMYLDEAGNVNTSIGLSTAGALAVGVPGTVDGMVTLHQKLGKLPWAEVVQPAIDLATRGVILTEREATTLNSMQYQLEKNNTYVLHFVKSYDGEGEGPWQKGDTLHLKDLARTLTRIRDKGRAGFYDGETANLIVREMKKSNGIITHQDLIDYHSVWRTPIQGKYKEYNVISMPPPSSGGIALLQLLQMVEPYDLKGWGWQSSNTVHVMAEAERRVYADRAAHLGDPDFYKVPVNGLLDKTYLSQRMASFSMESATPSSQIQAGTPRQESDQTTHYSIVDQWGNAASATTTLNGNYGSKVVVEGAGFLLNNEMDDFSAKPGVPNMFGLVGGEANAIAPGKRMLSSMTPTIVEKAGQLFMVVGTPGGSTIITSVFQTILNVLEHGMGMQEAVAAPRFHHQWLPDQIDYEPKALPASTRQSLQSKGHQLQQRAPYGAVEGILRLPNGKLEGGADPRGDDAALGY